MTGAVEIRKGTAVGVLTPSTPEDFAYINANLREMDKFEQDHFKEVVGTGAVDSLEQMEKSWTLHLKGEIVGYVALQVPPMASGMSTVRFVPMLSTKNVNHHPIDFARLSKPILRYVISQAPSWVSDFYSIPLARYEETVRWHEKTMGWKRRGEFDVNGEKAILFHIIRKEV